MSHVAASPLSALADYYKRLVREGGHAIPEFGFSREKIHFQIVLESDGGLAGLEDIRELNARGQMVPRPLNVPSLVGRTSGIEPHFCWDNTGYVLGRDKKEDPERAQKMFVAFRDLHLGARQELGDDEGFMALCRFLEQWRPERAETLPNWDEAAGLNVVFRLRGRQGYVHQGEAVKNYCRKVAEIAEEGSEPGLSLMSGQVEPLARLHPLIRGVSGAKSTGAAIVSFNETAYESYGRMTSLNAPVGIKDAFGYTTALNYLLADSSRRVKVGDATVVLWTDRSRAQDAEELFAAFFGQDPPGDNPAESGKMVDRLRAFFSAARQGRVADHLRDAEAPFYVLGLSPNASRINVRFWLADTVAVFAQRLVQAQMELELTGNTAATEPITIHAMLDETVPPKGGNPDRDKISPLLGGDVMRAVMLGLPYPASLLSAIVERIRVEGFVTRDPGGRNYRKDLSWKSIARRRAAILKAFLIRNKHWEVPVALDKDYPDEAYHLGRLFAALEKTQEDTSERELNSTIKDRYFGAASATPANVFPLLLRLHQHHMSKIDNGGLRVNREKLIGEICGHLRRFPHQLALEQQGLFDVGYYHQCQAFFAKRDETIKEMANA